MTRPARWFAALVGVAIVIAVATASGWEPPGGWVLGSGGVHYLLVAGAALAACVGAAHRSSGVARRAWWLVTASLGLSLIGELGWLVQDALGSTPYVSPADVSYLASYLPLAAALWSLARARDPEGGAQTLLDGVALAAGLGLLAWQVVVVAPGSLTDADGLVAQLVLVAYPLLDLVLVAALAAILLVPGRRAPSLWWILGFLLLWVLTDVVFATLAYGHEGLLPWIDVAYVLAYGAVGLAALDASAPRIADRQSVAEPSWARFTLLGTSLAAPAVTAAVAVTFFDGVQPTVFLLTSLLVAGIVTARVARTMAAERRATHDARAAERELARRLRVDVLTDLPNRSALLERVAALPRGAGLAVLFVDLDRFKVVNDAGGHGVGDVVLRQAAARIRGCLRRGDEVYRLAGDEFVVLAPDVTEPVATDLAARLLTAMEAPFAVDGLEWFVGCSVGIAVHPPLGEVDADRLIRDADLAMFAAKRGGRRSVRVFDEGLREGVERRHRLEVELRHAVERDDLDVAFQPVVQLADGEVVGFEVLTRWTLAGTPVPAAEVIETAEQTGLIGTIDERVLRRACRFITRYNERRPDRAPAFASVNLSTRDLAAGGLAQRVAEVVETTGVDPAWLVLELTEGALGIDPDLAVRRLAAVRDLGVRIAIDDFGTGYSSLAHLLRFPVDLLKVDRLFVHDLALATRDRSGAAAALKVASTLGLQAVAEGVERPDQADALRALGYELAQGYLFARPLTEADAARVEAATPHPSGDPLAARG